MNNIIHGDCLEELRKINDETFDMSFADPPFNLGKDYANYDDDEEIEDYLEWSREWIAQMIRTTKTGGTVLIHNIPKWLASYCCYMNNHLTFRHWIVWDSPTSPMGHSLQPAHYGILYYTKGDNHKIYELRTPHKRCRDKKCSLLLKDYGGKKHTIHPFGPLVSDVWTDIFRCKHKKYKDDHPCQLPVHLMERLILMSTDEGDAVLDPFAGAGTTLIAAKKLGREFCGIEKAEKYVKIGRYKLEQQPVSKINGLWVSCYINRIHTAREIDMWDNSKKEFKSPWKELYETWPDTDDKRRELNTKDLEFKKEVKDQIKNICGRIETLPSETLPNKETLPEEILC